MDDDDEPLSEEERSAIAVSREWLQRNPQGGIPFEHVVAECGSLWTRSGTANRLGTSLGSLLSASVPLTLASFRNFHQRSSGTVLNTMALFFGDPGRPENRLKC